MCGRDTSNRQSPQNVISNWREYDAPAAAKLRMAARNMWRRLVLRQSCCGNHGQPGC
jgi:hypothetical protein